MEKLIIIKTLKELSALKDYLTSRPDEFVSYDTETNGVEKGSKIIGFSICDDVGDSSTGRPATAYYVVLAYWDVAAKALVSLETEKGAKDLLSLLVGRPIIMQNAPFDCARTFENFGIELMPSLHTDTLMLGHLLNENRANGLKERGVELFGEDAKQEQTEMKESVHHNGGLLTKDCYELYKADADLIGRYGAKDAILTLKVFYHDLPILFEEGLDKFFYEDETMPLLRGPTYELNTVGLRVDPERLQKLKAQLQADCAEALAFIGKEVQEHVKAEYPGTSKAKTFNIGAGGQRAWLLFLKLGNEFKGLTDEGREVCTALGLKQPYTSSAKREFIRVVTLRKGEVYCKEKYNHKTKKMGRPKKVRDVQYYLAAGKESMAMYANKYKWVARYMQYAKDEKLLSTYVCGLEERTQYNIIRPSFLQHGTTSGRYSSRNPNFQNLPREDKRVKACIVARPGKVFVGADQSQLEPRVFASFSKDERLLKCFKDKDDFYSVVGAPIFGKHDCTLKKDGSPDSFPVKYGKLRDVSKVLALATPYGTLAPQMSNELAVKAGIVRSRQECQEIIDDYFASYPSVEKLMLDAHTQVKTHGVVYNLFGRPRRVPEALQIPAVYGKNTAHSDLPAAARNLLNLAMNHPIQSTGASIMNRSAIKYCKDRDLAGIIAPIVCQVHDSLIVECDEKDAETVAKILQLAMERTITLPGVELEAVPKIGNSMEKV